MPNWAAISFQAFLLVHSKKPPRSFVYMYSLYRSSGFFEMVGHCEMGVPLSSMNDKSLSSQALLVGSSSISYSLCRFSTLACFVL